MSGNTCGLIYNKIGVLGKTYATHRVIWAHYYEDQPPEFLDHIDGNPKNNSILNLRAATRSQNQANRAKTKNNKSGFLGVRSCAKSNKYIAQINKQGKRIHVGLFDTKQEAHEAYLAKKNQLFGKEWSRKL